MRIFLGLLLVPSLLYGTLTWKTEKERASIQISVHPDKLTLEDTIYIEASFRYPENYELDLNSLTSQLIGFNPLQPRLAMIESRTSSLENREGYRQQSLSFMVAPLEQGPLFLSFFNVLFYPLDNSLPTIEIFTPVFQVDILPPAIINRQMLPLGPLLPIFPPFPLNLSENNRQALYQDSEQLEQVAQYNERMLSIHSFPWMTTLLLACLFTVWWIIRLLRHSYQNTINEKASDQFSKENALKALKRLNEQQLPQQGQFKSFYTQLSELILTYLEEHFSLRLRPFTTKELQTRLLASHLPAQQVEELLALLRRADEVKFTNQSLSIQEWKTDENLVSTIIKGLTANTIK